MKAEKPWLNKFKKDFKNKKVLVMGLGLLGRGVQDAIFLCKIGACVTVTDLKSSTELASSLKKIKKYPIKLVLGKHLEKDFLQADCILRNAGVPFDSPFLKICRLHHKPIEMDESLFAKYAPVKIIGITGTRGKSTTTVLIYQILKASGCPVWLGGNVEGRVTLPLLAKINQNDLIVLELSSFQLQGFKEAEISPNIGVVTTIYEDHLNRYSSMQSYINDKKVIFQFQKPKDYLFLNKDFKQLKVFAREARSKVIWFSRNDFPKDWQLKIKGEHNRENCAAVIKIAQVLKISKKVTKRVIENFSGLAYRLQSIKNINRVEYINDTTSTTPASGIRALKALDKPIILLAGGASKNLSIAEFAKLISQKVKWVILLSGSGTEELRESIIHFGGGKKIRGLFTDFRKAVNQAKQIALPGEIILLSPGFASFGMFANEFDRGSKFNKIVNSFSHD